MTRSAFQEGTGDISIELTKQQSGHQTVLQIVRTQIHIMSMVLKKQNHINE